MNRRPLACIGITMLCTFAVIFYFNYYVFAAICLVLTVFGVLCFIIKRLREYCSSVVLVLAAAFFACSYFAVYSGVVNDSVKDYNGKTAEIVATVRQSPKLSRYGYYYELDSIKIDGKKAHHKILLHNEAAILVNYGDKITLKTELTRCDNNYYISKGYRLIAGGYIPISKYRTEKGKGNDIGNLPAVIRDKLLNGISELVGGEEGGLCRAVTLGDKFAMSPMLYDAFQDTGSTYLVVVSGMHMGIIASILVLLLFPLRKTRLTRIIRTVIIITFILAYLFVTGFQSSAVRAAVMIIVSLLPASLGLRYDTFTGIGIAAIALTLFNPFSVGDIGMLLSFGAVLGIAFLNKRIIGTFEENFFNRIKELNKQKRSASSFRRKLPVLLHLRLMFLGRAFVQIFAVSLSALAGVVPVSLVAFGTFNPLVILNSVLLSFAVTLLMFMTLLAVVLWFIPYVFVAAYPFAFCAKLVAEYIIFVVCATAQVPSTQVVIDPSKAVIWVPIILALMITGALLGKRRFVTLICAVLSVSVLCGFYFYDVAVNSRAVTITFYKTGGVTAVLNNSDSGAVLSCGGSYSGRKKIVEKLKYKHSAFDYMLIPNGSLSLNSYADIFLDKFDVRDIMMYYNSNTDTSALVATKSDGSVRTYGDYYAAEVDLGDGVTDTILSIGGRTWQYIKGECSTILIVPKYGNINKLPEKYRKAEFVFFSGRPYKPELLSAKSLIWTTGRELPKSVPGAKLLDADYTITLK